ncbi:hypothetical protein EQF93_08545, partial [Helcococcus ovis]
MLIKKEITVNEIEKKSSKKEKKIIKKDVFIKDIEVEEKLLVEENDANDISSIDFEDKEEDLELRAPVVTVMGH